MLKRKRWWEGHINWFWVAVIFTAIIINGIYYFFSK